MILPNKYTKLSESLFGLSAIILGGLEAPKSLDEIWSNYQNSQKLEKGIPEQSFANIILAIDLLFMFQAIKQTSDGRILKCG